jgi:MFS family permease
MHLENLSSLTGLMIIAYFIGFGFGGFVGPLADKFGRRKVFLTLLLGNLFCQTGIVFWPNIYARIALFLVWGLF